MTTSRISIGSRLLGAALLAMIALTPLHAQDASFPTSPRYLEILRLAQDGLADSARSVIAGILAALPESSPEYPEALFTSASVAKTGEQSRLQFSRVAVDFSNSAWADRALLRLAQLDYGTGDLQGTVNRVRRLMSEYPSSAVLPVAALWGARAALDLRDTPLACEWLVRGIDRVGNDIETRNQLEYTRQRCPAPGVNPAPVTPTDSTRPVTPPPPPAPAPAPDQRPWRVQVAAISDAAAIRRVEAAITRLGLTAYRLAGPGGLTKIQAGPFATREAALARVADLRTAVGGTPFVVRIE